jgi:hypothetical protein
MALQELSTNVINTMVKQSAKRRAWLRISLLVCVAVLGVQTARGQHAFEYAARVGANVLHYNSDYGTPLPNYNVGMDFLYKYRSPYYIGARVGLGIDVAASTFVGNSSKNFKGELLAEDGQGQILQALPGFSDHYIVPRSYEPNNMEVDYQYNLQRFTETQQMIIASVPVQLGLFVGDFSMFIGARFGIPVHGCYWQRVRNANLKLYYPDTDVTIPNSGTINPQTDDVATEDIYEPITTAGNVARTVNGINTLSKDAFPLYNLHLTAMLDLNYSFKIGDNTDFAIGVYAEYDPIGYTPKVTDNTSLMMWRYATDEHTGNPVFRREYTSVMEANYANGVTMHDGEIGEIPLVKKYHRASVGIRFSVSLWSVPLDFGKYYRKQQLYKVCMCDFF